MELKLSQDIIRIGIEKAFNRTNMELKRASGN